MPRPRSTLVSAAIALALLSACDGAPHPIAAAPEPAPGAVPVPGIAAVPAAGHSSASAGPAAPPMPASFLGANLPAVTDWSGTPVYADLVRQARPFGPPDRPWGGPGETVPVGPDGWPVGDFGVHLMSGRGMTGTYKVSFNGRATVSTVGSPATTLANQAYDPAADLTTLDVIRAPGAENMTLAFNGTRGGIRNLKVVRPGYDPHDPPLFTDEFLRHLARFQTLRFMDWLRTNHSRVSSWSQRASPDTRHASDAGVPWEHVVALANLTGKDVWINVPVRADDDYVLQLARLLKSTLDPRSRIYVEYSNELWNAGFEQAAANRALAVAEVRADPSSPLARDGTADPDALALRRVGKRLKEIADLFRAVFGDEAMGERVRPVLAGQVVQPFVSQVALEFVESVYGPPSRWFHAIAGAPYFNLGALQRADGLGTDAVLAAMQASVEALARTNHLEKNVALARWYGLRFLAYEGGSDTFGPGSLAAKRAASLDTRMLGLCRRYLATWYAAGGGTMMWYTAGAGSWDTVYGTYPITPDLSVETPKLRCLDEALGAPLPPLAGRHRVPGTIDAVAHVGSDAPATPSARLAVRHLRPGAHVDFLLLAPAAGTYALTLRAVADGPGHRVDVGLNGQTVAAAVELAPAVAGSPAANGPIAIALDEGFNTLRVRAREGTSWLVGLEVR